MILLGVLEMFCIGIVQAFCTASAGSVLFECLVRQWLADLGSWSLGLKLIKCNWAKSPTGDTPRLGE